MLDTSKIRVIPDFPKKGIQFLDITTIMNNADYFQEVFNMLLDMAKEVKPFIHRAISLPSV